MSWKRRVLRFEWTYTFSDSTNTKKKSFQEICVYVQMDVSLPVAWRVGWIFVFIRQEWSSGQSSWLQIQRTGFDSQRYQIFWEVLGLERGPLSLMSTIEELLGRKSSGSGLESRRNGRTDSSRWPRGTFYAKKLALSSPTSGGRSVGIVRSRTQATEFSSKIKLSLCLTKYYAIKTYVEVD
jgi:hypothetical protein